MRPDDHIDIIRGDPIEIDIQKSEPISVDILKNSALDIDLDSPVNSYSQLRGKPSINGVIVVGDKLGEDYNLQDCMDEVTPQEIDKIIYGG